jgi:Anaerobic dehydrogenases, typically selenocysteine-containing
VDIHPRDAAQQGIVDGDLLRISTPRGELRLKARIWDGVPVGALLIGWGWGETDPAGNLNDLTDDHRRNAVTATPSSRTFYLPHGKSAAVAAGLTQLHPTALDFHSTVRNLRSGSSCRKKGML